MHDNDERLMAQYGIKAESKVLFFYGGYRYERLADAVNYARTQPAPPEQDDLPHDSGDKVD